MEEKNKNIIEKALAILNRRQEKPKMGITMADALAAFPGAKVYPPSIEDLTKPKSCEYCEGNPHAKIVKRPWPSGKWDWMCHRCGRTVLVAQQDSRNENLDSNHGFEALIRIKDPWRPTDKLS